MVLDVAGSNPVTRPIFYPRCDLSIRMRPLRSVFALLLDLYLFFEYRCPSQGNDAGVAKLVDAPDLGSGILRCGGSSPSARTINTK